VIAGTARGKRLAAPQGMQTRPTADRVKEALFSIIQSRFELQGARVLDICAGSGGLGIEALSRGAASCCFIEQDRRAAAVLAQNLAGSGFAQSAQVVMADASVALRRLADRHLHFDLIFFDPPYASQLYGVVPQAIDDLSLLDDNGILIVECSSRSALPERIGALGRYDRRTYGDTALEFFTPGGAA